MTAPPAASQATGGSVLDADDSGGGERLIGGGVAVAGTGEGEVVGVSAVATAEGEGDGDAARMVGGGPSVPVGDAEAATMVAGGCIWLGEGDGDPSPGNSGLGDPIPGSDGTGRGVGCFPGAMSTKSPRLRTLAMRMVPPPGAVSSGCQWPFTSWLSVAAVSCGMPRRTTDGSLPAAGGRPCRHLW